MTGRPGLNNNAQRIVHGIVIVAGWYGFFYLWAKVLGRPWDSALLVALVLVGLLLVPLLHYLWIAHNKAIYRAKGPRKSVPAFDDDIRNDWLGRRYVADRTALRRAVVLVVQVERNSKVMAAATPPTLSMRDA